MVNTNLSGFKSSLQAHAERSTQGKHLVIQALAGTGKTTTLVEGLKNLRGQRTAGFVPSPQQEKIWQQMMVSDPNVSVCFVAFNKSIATELQRRVPSDCSAMTMHSMGFKAVKAAYGSTIQVDANTTYDLIEYAAEETTDQLKKRGEQIVPATVALVSKLKLTGIACHHDVIPDDIIQEVADRYDIDCGSKFDLIALLTRNVLSLAASPEHADDRINFDDMVWLPIQNNLHMHKYDLLLVDEAQDLNWIQQQIALRSGERLIFCGDPNQAIYGFAGADCDSMTRLTEQLGKTIRRVEVLPLTVTRRCSLEVVRQAQKIVPEFQAHSSNPEGLVDHMDFDESKGTKHYTQAIEPGDMAVCRVNGPLVNECLKLIAQGRRAEVVGRDIGKSLITTLRKLAKGIDWSDIQEAIDMWLDVETKKEQKRKHPSEAKLIQIEDRYSCMTVFADQADSLNDCLNRINEVFSEGTPGDAVRFSSIHRSKGLEAQNVYLLEPDGATVPHPMARTPEAKRQERNLRYVAITRAIHRLVYVS